MNTFKCNLLLSLFFLSVFAASTKAHTRSDTLIAYLTKTPPVIDGDSSDVCWSKASWYPIDELWMGPSMETGDFAGRYKLVWDKDYLYLLAEITDDSLSDDFPDPLFSYWADDCLEIFLDEDYSGGDQQYNYNAFSYHVSTKGDAIDLGDDFSVVSLNDNLDVMIKRNAEHKFIWEFAIKIYNDQFDLSQPDNSRVTLYANKIMGLTLGYCDNDKTATRENFIGSIQMPQGMEDFNWIMADYFGTLLLYDPSVSINADYKHLTPTTVCYNSPGKYISVKSKESSYDEVRLYDIKGLLVKKTRINNASYSQLSVREQQKGLYFIGLRDKNGKEEFYKVFVF